MQTKELLIRRLCTTVLAAAALLVLGGCNKNVSKEGRIRHLEAEILKSAAQIEDLERRVEFLESRPQDDTN